MGLFAATADPRISMDDLNHPEPSLGLVICINGVVMAGGGGPSTALPERAYPMDARSIASVRPAKIRLFNPLWMLKRSKVFLRFAMNLSFYVHINLLGVFLEYGML